MNKSFLSAIIYISLTNQILALDSISKFMREETQNKFGYNSGNIISPPGTNSSTVKGFKYYTNTEEFDEGYKVRKAVILHPKNENDPKSTKISVLQDVNYKDNNTHYTQEFSTVSVKDNQVQSITNCNVQVNRNAVTNQNYRDGDFPALVMVMTVGKVDEKITGQCFTITDKICNNLKKEFKSPDFKSINKELKACTDFSKKFSTGLIAGDYYKDIEESKSNISALKEAWKTVAYKKDASKYIDTDWNKVYDNLEQGERESFIHNMKKISDMISLCEKIEFYEPTTGNIQKSSGDSVSK